MDYTPHRHSLKTCMCKYHAAALCSCLKPWHDKQPCSFVKQRLHYAGYHCTMSQQYLRRIYTTSEISVWASESEVGRNQNKQCCRKCKILARLMDHLWLGGPSQLWVVCQSIICWEWDHATNKKNGQNGPNGIGILLRHNGHLISVHLWNRFSTFILKHFLHPLVAKRTIYGRTLGRPVDWWVAFGDRANVFQQHQTRELMASVYTDPSPSRPSVSELVATCSDSLRRRRPSSSKVVWCACPKPPVHVVATAGYQNGHDLGSELQM